MKHKITLQEVINRSEHEARLLYAIAETDQPTLKIGITKDQRTLARRLTVLNTGNPRRLIVRLVIEFTQDDHAYQVEQLLLRMYADNRVEDSEWLVGVDWNEILKSVQFSQSRAFVTVLPEAPIGN